MKDKLITAADNVKGEQPTPFIYYCITCSMPKMDNEGKPVLILGTETPVYETNYFCRRLIDKGSGVHLIEWDTDCHYAQRFRTETGATNYLNIVLKNLDGCKIS